MFRVRDTILSDDIATEKFACDVSRCKGACCVVGDAGAPVGREEIPVLRKAYCELKDELRPRAREVVEQDGLITKHPDGNELNCTDGEECVFVVYDEQNIAQCAIQKAYYEGRFSWEKPISCHLFPVRLKKIAGMEYANFEYVPSLCSAACEKGQKDGIYLSEFLEKALIRRYGEAWYNDFQEQCEEIRSNQLETNVS